jgi:hypothetical protein
VTANQVLIGVGLILIRADGRLAPVTASGPRLEPGDTMVLFCPAAEGP